MDANFQEYQWKGIDKKGTRLNGVIRAAGIKTVESELLSQEIEVISIKLKPASYFSKMGIKIKKRDIVYFTRYLSTMLSANMPILKALEVISHDPDNKAMQKIVVTIRNDISSGDTLADSFAKYPEYFSELYCNLVRAGEKSGTLDKILKRLATYLEKNEVLKSKIKKALVYPSAIIAVAVIVGLILLVFVMPQFETMFKSYGMKLPFFTQMIINLSNFIRSYWWLLVILVAGIVWGIKRILKDERIAMMRDIFVLKLYVIGPMLQKGIIARFTSTLAITIDAGLPILEAMQTMSNIMGNRVYSQAVTEISKEIIEGNPLSMAMGHTNLFPSMVIQMVTVGEASGALAEMLNNIARYYDEAVTNIVDNLSALLEPLVMVLLGLIIGTFVIAMYLPIFKMGSLF